ncbi:hypothetical protein QWY86_17430 [Pedobacter aquatilis]|uniref:hypothetical protein n=1 Tax=Pedobacter aquatilis TaxID=351343 RepID=UPI0025B48B00|nr:hypothetical protein [Pedobacter aquatilis]MDN3588469.1 hypothetical protein [Pedobacter aquatilis]
METRFEISMNMKTLKGLETYGCFNVGIEKVFATSLYAQLQGNEDILPDSVITIDLVKRENGLLMPLGLKHCNYHQLAENVKIITRELFKKLNLEA